MRALDIIMVALLCVAIFFGFTHGQEFLDLPMWLRLGISLPFVGVMALWIVRR